jgi:hypothetical protein
VERALNTDLIETRADALALVDADLITIQDYLALCRLKNWHPTGDAAAPAEQIKTAGRATPFTREGGRGAAAIRFSADDEP